MKAEFKILLCLAAMLVALEFCARWFETRLSINIAHLRDLPQQAARIRTAPEHSFKIVVVGNSLARCGIDVEMLKQGLREKMRREVVVAMLYPDGTRIEEWAYAYRRYFAQTGAKPDAVLMVTGRLHLTDQSPNVSEMGAFYVSQEDIGHYSKSQLHGLEDGVRFLGARSSALFAHRERVQPLLFYHLIPGYEQTAQLITEDSVTLGGAAPELHCSVLAWFVSELRQSGVRLVIASAPMPVPYSLPAVALEIARTGEATVRQSGAELRLPRGRFPDHYHLDAEGAIQFTRDLVEHVEFIPAHAL